MNSNLQNSRRLIKLQKADTEKNVFLVGGGWGQIKYMIRCLFKNLGLIFFVQAYYRSICN